ncbi:MAG: hypothetical protein V4563_15860 [Pseudomonadota bacterium]
MMSIAQINSTVYNSIAEYNQDSAECRDEATREALELKLRRSWGRLKNTAEVHRPPMGTRSMTTQTFDDGSTTVGDPTSVANVRNWTKKQTEVAVKQIDSDLGGGLFQNFRPKR